MSPTAAASAPDVRPVPLAPAWHTAALIALIVGVASVGTLLARAGVAPAPPARGRFVPAVLPLLVVQWCLFFYVCRLGRPRSALAPLLGRGWDGFRRASGDIALAVAAAVVIEASEATSGAWHNAAVSALMPHSGGERVAWVIVATSVGFCEEVVYRGYLQTQLAAFTRSPLRAIALQAVLFGVAHAEQGSAVAARFALYGAGFGVLARWRRSLLPGILCHVGIDVASGLLA